MRAGEVIGIAGVAGNGQGEFFEAISGEVLQDGAGRRSASAARMPGACPSPAVGCSAPPSCPKSGSAMAPRRA